MKIHQSNMDRTTKSTKDTPSKHGRDERVEKLLGPNFKMKLPTYPQDRNQAIVVPAEGHSGIDTLLLCSNFCQRRPFGFSTLRAFHFFIFLFFFILFISFFCFSLFFVFLIFFSALNYAWVALPGFQPTEPLKDGTFILACPCWLGVKSLGHL